MNEQQITQLFRDEWSTIEVGPAPVEAVVTASGRHRRRVVTSVTLGLAAVLALAVVLAVSIGGEPEADPVDPVDPVVRTEANPLDVAWVEGDELHLESVVVDVPASDGITQVVSLAQAPDGDSYGVVYSRFNGPIVHVAPDGTATTLDNPGTPVTVVGSGTEWVAWVDPSGAEPELVVWDTGSDEQVTRQPLPDVEPTGAGFSEHGRVLAIDGQSVYVQLPNGTVMLWDPQSDSLADVEVPGGQLIDTAGGVTLVVNRQGDEIRISGDGQQDVTVRGGYDAELSADGEHLFPGSPRGVGVRGGPDVLLSSTGEPVDFDLSDLEPEDVVLDQALGTDTATFVIGRDFVVPEDIEQDRGGYREVLLVTCTYADGSCDVAVDDLDAEPTSLSPVLFGF